MSLSFGTNSARTSGSSSPITTGSFTTVARDRALVLMLKTVGATDRAGAAPSYSGQSMTQASTTQKAAASPEAGCEIWYLIDPPTGAATASIPNTGSATIFYTLATIRTVGTVTGNLKFDSAAGSNGTSTNPTPTAASLTTYGCFGFAITAGGWTSWGPSAQVGTIIANTDDGADGGGEQYITNVGPGLHTLSWTFGTSDDWGAVAAYFREAASNVFENYKSIDADSGISVTEKIR